MNIEKFLFGLVVPVLLSMIIGCGGSHHGNGKMTSNKKDTATADIPPIEFTPIINVYIENSGSMDGYVKGQTEFEHIVYNYLVDLKQIRVAWNLEPICFQGRFLSPPQMPLSNS